MRPFFPAIGWCVASVGGSGVPEFLQMPQIQTLLPYGISLFKGKVVVWHPFVPTSPWVSHVCARLTNTAFYS